MRMRSRVPAAVLFAAVALVPLAGRVHAATLTWDADATPPVTGGTGNWDASTANWFNGSTDVQWADGSDAVFGATAGTVTVPANVSANSLTFANTSGGYVLNGPGTVSFATLTAPTTGGLTTTINAPVGGNNLTLVHNTNAVVETVNFGAATNSFTGNINLSGTAPSGSVTNAYRLQLSFTNPSNTAVPATAAFNFNRNFSQVNFGGTGDFGTLNNAFNLNNNRLAGSFNSDIGAGNANVTLAGLISGPSDLTFGSGGSGGAGVITLSNHETYTGLTRVITINTGGVVRLGVDNALPATTDVVFGSISTLATPSGAVDLNGHNQTVASIGNLAGQTGVQNGITNTQGATTTSTLTIKGNTYSTYAGPLGVSPNTTNLAGSSDDIALVLDAANRGTLTLAGATQLSGTTITGYAGTTYSDGTTVNGGTLLAANTSGSATGSGPVAVGPGGRLGSTTSAGTIAGHVTSSGTLVPGNAGAVGTLTLSGGLTANPGSNLNFDIASSGNDKLVLAGPDDATILSLPGSAPATPFVNINLNDLGSSINGPASYSLMSYPATTTLPGLDLSNFKVNRPVSGLGELATYTLSNNTANHSIDVTVSGTFGTRVTWKGDSTAVTGSGNWDNSSSNFVDTATHATPMTYADPDEVTIDDSQALGSDPIVINVDPAGVTPANTIVTNGGRTVTIQGGPIMGGSVTKSGSGTLILAGANSYAGGTVVNGPGVLAITSDAALGAVPAQPTVNVTLNRIGANIPTLRFDADMTLDPNRNILLTTTGGGGIFLDTNGHSVTVGGQILFNNIGSPGAGFNLIKAGAGTLTLGGNETGNAGSAPLNVIQINNGTIAAAADSNFGKPGNNFNFASSGGTVKILSSFSLGTRSLTVGSPATVDTNGFNTTIDGVISGANTFTKAGDGTLLLDGPNTLTGKTVVAAGTLLLKPASFIPLTNAGGVTLNGGKLVLDYTGASAPDVRTPLVASHNSSPTFTDATQRFRTTNPADPNKGIGYVLDPAASTVTLMYTLYGDANLNGVIDPDDYALLDAGAARAAAGWQNGDFDYSGTIDSADYLLIDTNLGQQQGGHFSPAFLSERQSEFGPAYVSALLASVPEPAVALSSILCPLSSLLLKRRRVI